ncbi:UNVERIFIED_CONTAM: Retrovirus-related Pol polyprotein from transposon opus [Sesamum calycinum]|uniref:Retrovirus-related Pol polyprotein from transposon opus n=1 Tax=Sesamum calycinum TaxID=2727403 RepID=A0AAW2JJH3_9LAMI
MCIDFTDLNKACPKDSYPLPRIDALIDSMSGCELMSFLNAFQGYNQIRLAHDDQEKTSFVTDQGIFCYNVMPFGLKNAGATYQRLVNNMFREQIGDMEVYIDDMMVKSQKKGKPQTGFARMLWHTAIFWDEAELDKMHIRRARRKILRIHDLTKRNRSQSRKDQSNPRNETPQNHSGGPKVDRKIDSTEPLYLALIR